MAKISSKLWAYALTFLVPLTIRSIPEVINPYLLGPDTPYYILTARSVAESPRLWVNPLYALLGLAYRLGADMEVFMKVYAPVVFSINVFLLTLYAQRKFASKSLQLLTTALIVSVFPAFLRLSWDLHRQSFALIFLNLMLFVDFENLNARRIAVIGILAALMGLTHELIFGIALVILAYQALRYFLKRSYREGVIFSLLCLTPFVVYVLIRLLVTGRFPNVWAMVFTQNYRPFLWGVDYSVSGPVDWWLSLLIVSIGFFLPVSVLGYFRDERLTAWLGVTLFAYVSYIVSPYLCFNMPARWFLLSSVPLALYSANFVSNLKRGTTAILLIAVLSIQAVSMVGLFQTPLAVYADQRYGAFSDILTTPVGSEAVASLKDVASWLKTHADNDSIIITPYEMSYYTLYLLDGQFRVVSQDRASVKPIIKEFLAQGNPEAIYFVTYSDRPAYKLPYVEQGVYLEPVRLMHPLIVYRLVRV